MANLSLKGFLSKYKYIVAILLIAVTAVAAFIPGNLQVQDDITLGGTVDGRDVATDGSTLDNLNTTLGLGSLTAAEVTQLQNIDTETIINSQWAFLGASDQGIATGDSPTFDGIKLSDALIFDQISTPSNPSSGDNKLYFKSDGLLYRLDSSGIESLIGVSEVVNSDSAVVTLEAAFANCDATPTITRELGDWLDNVTPITRASAGKCTLTANPTFNVAPFCTCTPVSAAVSARCLLQVDTTTSTIKFDINNSAGGFVDGDVHIICIGEQ